MLGILTEKPSAARNFAKALVGAKGSFNGEDYVIVNARGHLYEFVDVFDMVEGDGLKNKYKSWDVGNLPWQHRELTWKRKPKEGVSGLLQELKKTLSSCSEIAIATDVDPTGEGDLLALEIIEELKLTRKKITRFHFVDESEKEIQKAFKTRKIIPDMNSYPDYRKALYRSKFDFLTMQFTRIAKHAADGVSILRQGRLKSAMVVITGDGLKAVAGYKKIPFYQNRFRDENGNVYSNPNEPQFPIKSQVPQSYKTAVSVVKESMERKFTPPKKLIDLATLAAILAPKGYKSKDVLDTYQKMYEAQIVSYPRTEDKVISPEQFNELLPLVERISNVVGVDVNLLTHKTPRKTHVKSGGAHGANRPGLNVPQSLDSLVSYGESAPAIYEVLAKSYLAMLAEDYEYDFERGYIAEYPEFKATASIPVKPGWKQVFGAEESDEEADENNSGRHIGTRADIFIHEGFPTKPPTPTMKWLMAQLAKRDVGTGATRTSTYAEVTNEKTKYPLLVDKKGKLSMTNFGEMSYSILPGTKIGSVELTEELQNNMRAIASGVANPEQLLAKVADYVVHDLRVMTENGKGIAKIPRSSQGGAPAVQTSLGKCPKCGKDVVESAKSYSCVGGKECGGFFMWEKKVAGKVITMAQVKQLLKKGKTAKIKGFKGRNGEFEAFLVLKKDGTVGFEF